MDRQEQQKRARELSLAKENAERERKRSQRQGSDPTETQSSSSPLQVEKIVTPVRVKSETDNGGNTITETEAVMLDIGNQRPEPQLEVYNRRLSVTKRD